MLTKEEKDFLVYWENNRDRQKRTFRQWLIGLPIGMVFGIPIILNYFSGWNKRAGMVGGSQLNPIVLLIAVLAIISFSAIFYKQFQWDQYEQRYRELKVQEDRDKNELVPEE